MGSKSEMAFNMSLSLSGESRRGHTTLAEPNLVKLFEKKDDRAEITGV